MAVQSAEALVVLLFLAIAWPRPGNRRSDRLYILPVLGALAFAFVFFALSHVLVPLRSVLLAVGDAALMLHPAFLVRLAETDEKRLNPGPRLVRATSGLASLGGLALPFVPHGFWWFTSILLVLFGAGEVYATVSVRSRAAQFRGVARQRMNALSLASAILTVTVAGAAIATRLPFPLHERLIGLGLDATALLYLVAFAAPGWLRRLWQVPVLMEYFRSLEQKAGPVRPRAVDVLLAHGTTVTGGYGSAFLVRDRSGDPPAYRVEAANGRAEALLGIPPDRLPRDFLEEVWHSPKAVLSPRGDAKVADFLAEAKASHALLCPVPGTGTPSKSPLGLLAVFAPVSWVFVEDDAEVLDAMAQYAATRIENDRLFQEQKQALGDLAEANERLARANQTKGDFLAGMSHELRTPLNSIIGFSDLLLEGRAGPLTERQERYARNILESGQHLLAIVNDVLDIAKVDAARLELRQETVNVSDIVTAAIRFVKAQADRVGIELVSEVAAHRQIAGDELRVRQVLINLLSNAVKFTPRGGKVWVRDFVRDRLIEISVIDTGIGIAPEHQATIFDEFTQVSHGSDRTYEGTGLGLALVRRLCEWMGGGVRVESAPGQGSTFTIHLPLADAPEAADVKEQAAGPVRSGHTGLSVLVLDDDEKVRELASQVLSDVGCQVTAVATVTEARSHLVRRTPHLILLDVLLENGEDGYDLLSTAQALEPTPVVLVISVLDAGRRPMPLPVKRWLVKPIRPDELREAVLEVACSILGEKANDGS